MAQTEPVFVFVGYNNIPSFIFNLCEENEMYVDELNPGNYFML